MFVRSLFLLLVIACAAASTATAARADDTVNLAIGQKGNWETSVAQLGVEAGFFRKEHLLLAVVQKCLPFQKDNISPRLSP